MEFNLNNVPVAELLLVIEAFIAVVFYFIVSIETSRQKLKDRNPFSKIMQEKSPDLPSNGKITIHNKNPLSSLNDEIPAGTDAPAEQ